LRKILQIGNWPPPMCGWAMGLVALRKELEGRGWDCQVMNVNEKRRVRNPACIDVQDGWDYLRKVWWHVRRGFAVHVRVNGESKKGYILALMAMALARLAARPALLTYCGGHRQTFFPAPKLSFRFLKFSLLFRITTRIYCNSEPVKQALLTTGIAPFRVLPIPTFSTRHLQFTPCDLPIQVNEFQSRHNGFFFLYACYRKEYMLDLVAEVMGRFRARYSNVGFVLAGTSDKELEQIRTFFRDQGLEQAVCVTGSVGHDVFLTMLTHSLACIRTPLTDGVSSSVMEALGLGVPVLGSDNGTRPEGVELWRPEDPESLLKLMTEAVSNRKAMVARIPQITVEDNTRKMADDIEAVCLSASSSKLAGQRSGAVAGS
jgi:glycosyltransferase involved in cell wall biosynthesis